MTDVEKIKYLFTKLKWSSERDEVKKFIEDYIKGDTVLRENFNTQLNNVRNKSLGPTSSAACSCCGK